MTPLKSCYEYDALAFLYERGVTELIVWCVHLPCTNRSVLQVSDLMKRHGPGYSLVMIARHVRCGRCKKIGGQVQPNRPVPYGAGHLNKIEKDVWKWLD